MNRSICPLSLLLLLLSVAEGNENGIAGAEIRKAPNGEYFVAWFDTPVAKPNSHIRTVYAYTGPDYRFDAFSLVTYPRFTEAAWSPDSRKFIVADAPDNGNLDIWLVTKSKTTWTRNQISPFQQILAQFHADPNRKKSTLFRPSLRDLKWIDNDQIQFRLFCNLGTFLVSVDARNLELKPKIEEVSEKQSSPSKAE